MQTLIIFCTTLYLSFCQSNRNQRQLLLQPLSATRRGFTPHISHLRLPKAIVLDALPMTGWNGRAQRTPAVLVDEKAADTSNLKNAESILAGNMSKAFLQELSDYLYGLMSGKRSGSTHRARHSAFRRGRHSNELLDYEDEARARDAEELTKRRSMPVMQTDPRSAILSRRNNITRIISANNVQFRSMRVPLAQNSIRTMPARGSPSFILSQPIHSKSSKRIDSQAIRMMSRPLRHRDSRRAGVSRRRAENVPRSLRYRSSRIA
ncbi:unnamed protein product [Cylicocyclus nassatus]|uniref:Uncharacterized protein n=1 Tax=Cylicocyclus nassatus TaxID=53992 RepID=A0AA36DPX5_CYLNA|nr:unnamed protein product [Cylicocyclus nassatus]